MPTPSMDDHIHDEATSIDLNYLIRYTRGNHRHKFPIELQRRIYDIYEQTWDLSKTTKRYNELSEEKKYISSTVIGAVLRKIEEQIENITSKPQSARVHWNYVTTGSRADPAPSPTQQANDRQRAATQSGSGSPPYGDSDYDKIDFDEEETSQSMNTTRVRREAPRTQRAVTPAHDLDIPDMIDAFGKKLGTSRGPTAARPTSFRQTGSRQTEHEQHGTLPGLDVAELMSTFKNDLDSRRGETDRGRGQTDRGWGQTDRGWEQTDRGRGQAGQRQGRTDYGQQETSDKIDVAQLMGTFGKKLESAREQEGRSSSRAAGKRKHQS